MKLSIITINYNNLAGIKKTVDSVLSQTWRDFEWIIVDGGSNDGSKEYIETLAQSLSEGTAIDRVQWCVDRFSLPGFTAEDLKSPEGDVAQSSNRPSSIDNRQSIVANRQSSIDDRSQRFLWCSEPDRGIYNALNKGIAKANGLFSICLNSGDMFYDNLVLASFTKKERISDVLYGYSLHIFKDREEVCHMHYPSDFYALYKYGLCHQAMFVKTDVLKRTPFDERFLIAADYSLWINLAISGYHFDFLDFCVCRYDGEGISSLKNIDILRKEHLIIQQQIPYFFKKTLDRIDRYKYERIFIRIENILDHHKHLSLILKAFLFLIDKLYLKIDFRNYTVKL